MQFTYYIKHVYGVALKYPDNDNAKQLLSKMNSKTFTPHIENLINFFGGELAQVMTPANV